MVLECIVWQALPVQRKTFGRRFPEPLPEPLPEQGLFVILFHILTL